METNTGIFERLLQGALKFYHWIVGWVKKEIHKILELKDSQHAIAGGVAVGIFFGFTPFFGLKTLLSLGVAWLLGFNLIAAVVAVSLHDIIIILTPLLMGVEYQIGFWILHRHAPPAITLHHHPIRISEVLNTMNHPLSSRWWDGFLKIGLPLTLGSLVIALPSALISYNITLGILNARKKHAEAAKRD